MNKLPAILLMILVFTLPLANSAEAAFNLSSFFGGGSQTTKTTAQQKSTTTTSGTVIGDINKSTGQEDPFVHFENKDEDTVDNDLIIEVTGYQPTIIDANLLENQNVYVTALLSAIPINPSISIPKIRDITVRKTNITVLPKTKSATVKVAGVQYVKPKDVELSFANLGYLVITLEKIPKEADVPDSVTIGIQAEIHLDVYSSVGARATEDVLIAESFDDWKENKEQHKSFAGYIQATAIT
ncbi:MAG: hypothetical protein Q7R96_02750, partial [Nanoarchaeota archaeon]|nr:hypothetical protein [Nanoarchaeota archaeon]